MKIKSARLHNYRNIEISEADLDAQSVWICGGNAQGKTNLLESVGLLGALRSFRTSKTSNLIRHGQHLAQALFQISHEKIGDCSVLVEISSKGRKVFIDDIEQRRLADFIGKFPVTVLSSDDIKLVRGAPAERRKFIDMLVSSLDGGYFEDLRAYHSALAHRNALLKNVSAEASLFDSFECEMACRAFSLSQKRALWLERLAELAGKNYALFSGGRETAAIKLRAGTNIESIDGYRKTLASERRRDAILGATSIGPHRDDFSISVNQKNVKEFASEGQQRSVVLSLKLAEYELCKNSLGMRPILLCDDILGELDENRRSAFWAATDPECQLIATSTSLLPSHSFSRSDWRTMKVEGGIFSVETICR